MSLENPKVEKSKNRLADDKFWTAERAALVETLEDFVSDPSMAHLGLATEIPDIVSRGGKVDGTHFVDDRVKKFAAARGYSDEELAALRERVLNSFFVIDPLGDKNFTIGFIGHDPVETKAYNVAVRSVMEEHDLSPFHQLGSHDEIGEQHWEAWQEVTREKMLALVKEIEAVAKKKLVFYREMYREE